MSEDAAERVRGLWRPAPWRWRCAMAPAAGLALIEAILARGDLSDYHLAHAARADLCRRLGRTTDARASYERALLLTDQEPQRRFLERRLTELRG